MKKFVAIIIVLVLVSLVSVCLADTHFYPKAAVVTGINIFEESITVKDGEGFLWEVFVEFDKTTNISLGDVVALLMWDAETPDHYEDDEIIDLVFEHFRAELKGE